MENIVKNKLFLLCCWFSLCSVLLFTNAVFAQGDDAIPIQIPANGYLWFIVVLQFIGFGIWVGKINATVSKLDRIPERVSELEGVNKGKTLAKTGSPMKLTEEGEKLLNDSGGKKYLKDNESEVLKQFDDVNNAFDIQERAKSVIRKKVGETNGLEDIKKYLFDNGKTADDIILVMGLELRDMVLSDKGVEVEQVDADKGKSEAER